MNSDFPGIKAIFFDTSDTLYKNEGLELAYPQKLAELIAQRQSIPTVEAKQLLDETTKKLKATEKHVTKVRAAEELGFSRAEVHEKAFCKVVPGDYLVKDEALDALMSRLANRYKLGIISNLKKSHMLEVLNALGLSPEWFPLMVTEDIVKEIKPAAEPFLKAVELAACSPSECVYVGDSPTKDMQPAKGVGMKTVLVAQSPTDEDMQFADASIVSVKDIISLLNAE
jgi:HAD superfamily hydrolase (TIGR01549 family)